MTFTNSLGIDTLIRDYSICEEMDVPMNQLTLFDNDKEEKCSCAFKLLYSFWQQEIHRSPFLKLLDPQKIAFDISLQELNQILKNGPFTLEEKTFIKRIRHQGRNNKAAQRLRNKTRQQNSVMRQSIAGLRQEKIELMGQKEHLIAQVVYYQGLLSQ